MELFGEFVYSLAEDHYSFADFLCRTVYEDENKYIISTAQKAAVPAALRANAQAELKLFTRLSRLDAKALCEPLGYDGYIPEFEHREIDFEKTYAERLEHIGRYGYGVFASAKMFRVAGEEILPVEAADEISLDSFVGYEEERKKVFDNTRALIDGKPAANVLLFGDAGTGKSSTVKACANYFYDQGVRLIELRKDQLFSLSYIMGRIADNPLKFIIFIDDLSFNKNDDCFSMLKAALEGSASAKAKNAVIYATSNRRHIVKENFSDRATSDDVHHSDTVQELMSLSDRFGLTVYFSKPNKILYLDIIHKLAEKNGIAMEQNQLDIKAEAFALAKGSRSPRAAEQFINSLI
ncbi:MAG: ATP-binding protein [Firmicutes bacterium]|nr:ATP-binding protein [Bacillota bacterium]